MATAPPPDVELDPVNGEARPLEDWLTTFHLVLVVVDPYTYESSWLLATAARIMGAFRGTDARMAWLVAGTQEQAQEFLGPLADEFLTFADPDREMVRALGLELLPAIVHIDHARDVQASAEGWDPPAWRAVTDQLAETMRWSKPVVPGPGDPNPFEGTAALG